MINQERLKRNITPHRLEHKPLKRNEVQSEQNLRETFKNHRLNSGEGEIKAEQYVRINNTNKSAVETAKLIKRTFNL
ncbi:hypothetical protein GCM10010954_36070 [Halobacillus andaensis]|uniref:Uncharacterized protein n=1 Tax=Halobacillus andaensis TaxID=1176239 RepID=A0A917F0V8_HALAA|nr:hypothetical protein GCM10010954_36070 [Halobacillus andaensis]